MILSCLILLIRNNTQIIFRKYLCRKIKIFLNMVFMRTARDGLLSEQGRCGNFTPIFNFFKANNIQCCNFYLNSNSHQFFVKSKKFGLIKLLAGLVLGLMVYQFYIYREMLEVTCRLGLWHQ